MSAADSPGVQAALHTLPGVVADPVVAAADSVAGVAVIAAKSDAANASPSVEPDTQSNKTRIKEGPVPTSTPTLIPDPSPVVVHVVSNSPAPVIADAPIAPPPVPVATAVPETAPPEDSPMVAASPPNPPVFANPHPAPKGPAKALASLTSLSQRLVASVKDAFTVPAGKSQPSLPAVPESAAPSPVARVIADGERECALCFIAQPIAAFVTLPTCGHMLCRDCASGLFKFPRMGVVQCPFRHRNDREPCDGCIPTSLLPQLAPDTLDKMKDVKPLRGGGTHGVLDAGPSTPDPPSPGVSRQTSVINTPQPLDPEDQGNFEMLMERVRERTVVPWVGAGASISFFPLWEGLLRELWKQKRRLTTPQATDDELTAQFKAFFEGELGKDAPILTDLLGTHREVVANIIGVFDRRIEDLGAKYNFTAGEVAALQAAFVHAVTLEGDNARNWKPEVKKQLEAGLATHAAIVCGPWPLIMTSNWDSCLEASWDFKIPVPSDGFGTPHPGEQARATCLKSRMPLTVRLRADASLVFADVKRAQTPPPLLKLHGDFSPRGRAELVAGHAQYRKLMVREVSFCHLLRHIGSRFSFLFYGCSLSDQDLLSSLDDIKENLGAEIGPHFWLTADDVHPERRKFLLRHYSLRVIRMPGRYNFSMLETYMAHVSKFGWYPPTSKAAHLYEVQPDGFPGATLSVRLQCTCPDPSADGRLTHVGITATSRNSGISPINHGAQRRLLELHGVNDLRYLVFAVGAPHWRALPVPLKPCAPPHHPWRHYLLCEQASGGNGNPPSVYQAVQDFLHRICVDHPSESNINIVLHTIASEGSTILETSTFNATLSALGVAVGVLTQSRGPVQLNVTLVIPRGSGIWGNIHAGVLKPAATLKRAIKGKMAFSCVFPERLEGMTLMDTHDWACRTVTTNIQAAEAGSVGTIAELKQILQLPRFPAGFSDHFPILRYVVDGASLQLIPTIIWADIFSDDLNIRNPRMSPVVKWTEKLRVGLPFTVKVIHCGDNKEILQIIRNIPCFAVISSSRFGEAFTLFAELLTPEMQQYFQGVKVIWSKTILTESAAPSRNARALAERKRYTDLGVFADPTGSFDAVMAYLGEALTQAESPAGTSPTPTPPSSALPAAEDVSMAQEAASPPVPATPKKPVKIPGGGAAPAAAENAAGAAFFVPL